MALNWLDGMELLDSVSVNIGHESIQSQTNEPDSSPQTNNNMEIPIFKPTLQEWNNFDEFLNKIARFVYLVGICKLLPPIELVPSIVTYLENQMERESNKQQNGKTQYLLRSNYCQDIYTLENHGTEDKYPEDNFLNSVTDVSQREIYFWQNLEKLSPFCSESILNYSNCLQTLFDNNSIVPIPTLKPNSSKDPNRVVSAMTRENEPLEFSCSFGTTKRWEILAPNTFKLFFLQNKNATRVWYSIQEEDTVKFYKLLQDKLLSQSSDTICPNFLNHQHFIITPTFLENNDIKFSKIVQYHNEMVILFPSSCTFAIDLTENNIFSSICFQFKVDNHIYSRSAILQNCLCDNYSSGRLNGNSNNVLSNINSLDTNSMKDSNSINDQNANIIQTNNFNESISRISSPLIIKMLNDPSKDNFNNITGTIKSNGLLVNANVNNNAGNNSTSSITPSPYLSLPPLAGTPLESYKLSSTDLYQNMNNNNSLFNSNQQSNYTTNGQNCMNNNNIDNERVGGNGNDNTVIPRTSNVFSISNKVFESVSYSQPVEMNPRPTALGETNGLSSNPISLPYTVPNWNTGSLQYSSEGSDFQNEKIMPIIRSYHRVTKPKRYSNSQYNELLTRKFERDQATEESGTQEENEVLPSNMMVEEDEIVMTRNGKVYVCFQCKRKFSSGHHLTRHKRSVHTGEKPHSCPRCGKKFKRRDHVLQHLNKKMPCSPAATAF